MSAIRYHVRRIRLESGVSQSEVAAKLGVSASRLSRMESGEAELTIQDAREILEHIPTPAAREYATYLDTEWHELSLVPFDHPDWQLLAAADTVLRELRRAKADPELKAVFLRRLELYEGEVRHVAEYVLDPRHTIAVIGSIGIGKTTAICYLANLLIEGPKLGDRRPVLEVGGGATTVCEVAIKPGPNYGLMVDARSDDAIRKEVQDFADFLLLTVGASGGGAEQGNSEEVSISKETVRAIRNMAGLAPKRGRTPDGKMFKDDPAQGLARQIKDSRELAIEILTRMDLPRRDRRTLWFDGEQDSEPLAWIQKHFSDINNGRNPEFGLPKRIDVVLPSAVLHEAFSVESDGLSGLNLDLHIVDTKGIDQTAERADLERHFYDNRTITVLCSGFNDAPEQSAQTLLQRALDAKAPDVDRKAMILVLPRAEEAVAVRDEAGNFAETDEDGYDLKSEQVELRLNSLGVGNIPCVFFNAMKEDPAGIRTAILRRIDDIRELQKERLQALLVRVRNLVENAADAQRVEVMALAARQVSTWLERNRKLKDVRTSIEDDLLNAIGRAHASTIRASIRRRGDWHNLDYGHHLSYGARAVMSRKIDAPLSAFRALVDNLRDTEDFDLAADFIDQIRDMVESSVQQVLKDVQIAGPTVFEERLEAADDLWWSCIEEWGAGRGFRERVKDKNSDWFQNVQELVDFMNGYFQEKWDDLLGEIAEVLAVAMSEEEE